MPTGCFPFFKRRDNWFVYSCVYVLPEGPGHRRPMLCQWASFVASGRNVLTCCFHSFFGSADATNAMCLVSFITEICGCIDNCDQDSIYMYRCRLPCLYNGASDRFNAENNAVVTAYIYSCSSSLRPGTPSSCRPTTPPCFTLLLYPRLVCIIFKSYYTASKVSYNVYVITTFSSTNFV